MKTTTIQGGVIGLLFLVIAAMGGDLYFSTDQLDKAYICTTNQNIGLFDRLSSTSKTGYWIENGTEFSKVCTNGIWMNLKTYASQNNLNINVLSEASTEWPAGVIQYSCDQKECRRIK